VHSVLAHNAEAWTRDTGSLKMLARAASHQTVTTTSSTLADVPGVVVAAYCSGAPLILEVSGFTQTGLDGDAIGTSVAGQLHVIDENSRDYWINSVQSYMGSAGQPMVVRSHGTHTLPFPNPGWHMFKLQFKVGTNGNGIFTLFGGAFSAPPYSPLFDVTLTLWEVAG
jgi:hypothetical protein